MWFWSGVEVDATQITDVAAYNKENAIMWKRYSLWYIASGVAQIWSSMAFAVILVLGNTLGLVLLILGYQKILKKYKVP